MTCTYHLIHHSIIWNKCRFPLATPENTKSNACITRVWQTVKNGEMVSTSSFHVRPISICSQYAISLAAHVFAVELPICQINQLTNIQMDFWPSSLLACRERLRPNAQPHDWEQPQKASSSNRTTRDGRPSPNHQKFICRQTLSPF